MKRVFFLVCVLLTARAVFPLDVDPEYTQSLDGAWRFVPDPEMSISYMSVRSSGKDREITVPSCWEAAFPDLIDYDGTAWYWRDFHLPERWNGKRIILTFHAVDYEATVWVNRKKAGGHEGGYTPFSFDVTDLVDLYGNNELVVKVFDPGKKEVPGKPLLNEVPAGKQGHYCNIGGLWQGVDIAARSETYLENLFVWGDPQSGEVRLKAFLNRKAGGDTSLKVSLFPEKENVKLADKTFALAEGGTTFQFKFTVQDPVPWSPEAPELYRVVSLLDSGDAQDRTETRFGFRTVEKKNGRILLNGKPFYMRFALDQDYYPGTLYTTPSVEYARRQFRLGKELGLNGNRTHIKIPCPSYLEAADREGFVLWIDFPSWFNLTSTTTEAARRQMREWIARDFNHPSIIAWSLVNEEWGLDMRNEAMRRFLKMWWEEVKLLDPTRFVVDNSPAGGNHVISDFADQHAYFAIPEQRAQAEKWIEKFSTSRAERFPWPESERAGDEPLIWSEMGDWGHPDVERLRALYAGWDPYWFDQGNYGGPIAGGIERFFELGLDAVYGGLSGFARAAQLHEEQALRHQLAYVRRFPQIAGYVITQFTDLNSESNGLMDMTRGKKVFHDRLGEVCADVVVIPDPASYSFFSGTPVGFKAAVSNWSGEAVPAGEVLVKLDGEVVSRSDVRDVKIGETVWTERSQLKITAEKPCYKELVFLHQSTSGKVYAKNRMRVFATPAIAKIPLKPLSSVPEALASLCTGSGPVHASGALDGETVEVLKNGGKVLYFPDVGPSELSLPFQVSNRMPGGGWMQPQVFFRTEGPGAMLAGLPETVHLELGLEGAKPAVFLRNLPAERFRSNAVMGSFAGWMHDCTCSVALFKVFNGELLFYGLSTEKAATDAASAWMLSTFAENFGVHPMLDLGEPLALSRMIIRPGSFGKTVWRYTTRKPGGGWQDIDFDDARWDEGAAPFGTQDTPNLAPRTRWFTPGIWLRKKFVIKKKPVRPELVLYHDEDCEVFINGKQVAARKGFVTGYVHVALDEKAAGLLKPGECVIAVYCSQSKGGQGIDVGLKAE